ncbi:MAG: histidine phosphatase family protein [Pseudomonadota bacterium]|nr:histidine phosphatase family protein [Pseudomonadota bacterium]
MSDSGPLIAALVRHCDYRQLPDVPSAHQPFPLTETGRRQAREAAGLVREAIEDHGWSTLPGIDSSQLLRAWETARIIAAEPGPPAAPVETFDALAERGLGCAANLTVGQIEDIIRADPRFDAPPAGWKSASHYRLPLQGAESLMQAGRRVADHLIRRIDELRANGNHSGVKLFVGHGAAFRHAAFHLGVLDFGEISKFSMYHGRPVFLEALPDGSWRHRAGKWKVRQRSEAFTD